MAEKILVVEDEPSLRETLAYNLTHQGYRVETASDGRAALDMARNTIPDLIILDIMLPEIDGFEVCRILRREITTPVLMLTARDDEIDRVVGLEVGADDYMIKPFSMRELIARVRAMLRRVRMIREENTPAEHEQNVQTLRSGNLEVNLTRHEVILDENILSLSRKEYDLLVFLMQRAGQVLSRDSILHQLWGWEFTGDSRTVDVHVRWLREKIEAQPDKPTRIITVRGAGYRFES